MIHIARILFVLLGMTCFTTAADEVTLRFDTSDQRYAITFDPLRIPESQVRTIISLSPYTGDEVGLFATAREVTQDRVDKFFLPPSLELCTSEERAIYFKCGSRNISDPDFFRNAEMNIQIAKGQLASMERTLYPKELEKVVEYLRQSFVFILWAEETRLDFYRTWDASVLGRSNQGIEPASSCAAVIVRINSAKMKVEKYNLAKKDWHNCVLEAFKKKHGSYPLAEWQKFLLTYGVKEEHLDVGPDE